MIQFLVAAASVCASLSAATYVLKAPPSTLADWKNGEFYEGGVAPTGIETDTIATKNENNLVIELDGANETPGENNATFAFLGGMRGIILSNAVLKVTVPAGHVATFNCAVWDNSTRTGTLEKYGLGELFLAARLKVNATSTSPTDFENHLHVFEGTVRLTRDAEKNHQYHQFHSVTIEKPAKVITLYNGCVWQVRGLYGEGMITNEESTACSLYVVDGKVKNDGGDFKGVIGGNIAIQARSCKFTLSGTNNTFSGGVSSGQSSATDTFPAEFHLVDFGEKSRVYSSAGLGSVIIALSAYPFVYDGIGQTTDREFQLNYLNSVLSGGTNGNLTVAGCMQRWDASKRNIGLVLDGDSLYPCTFNATSRSTGGAVEPGSFCDFEWTVGGVTTRYNYYMRKRGTGEWHFPLTGRFRNTGVFAVENGILSFDSIDRAGELTALGYSTRLYDNVEQPTDDAKVDYAFLLGSDVEGAVGLMECTTNLARQCTNRPFGLKGKGGFLANRGLVKYAKVFGVGSGEKTLVLDGTNTLGSEVHDVADRRAGSSDTAIVSVEKNGTGTWVLGGDQTFSGSLTVNGGTLIVRRPEQSYQRYRLMVMAMAIKDEEYGGSPTEANAEFHIAEIGLYAADDSRQNLNLKYNPAHAALAPGECALGLNRTISNIMSGPYNVYELLFDGYRKRFNDEEQSSVSWHAISGHNFHSEGMFTTPKTPVYGQPTTYVPFDMYLTADAKPIDHFDVMSSSGNNARIPSRMQLQASVDGIHWDEVSDIVKIAQIAPNNNYWLSGLGGSGYSDGGSPTKIITSAPKSTGWKTTKTAPTKVFSLLENVGAVTVANGATLRYEGATDGAPTLSQVKLAAGATGSIDGFAFAENGTFEIDEMAKGIVSVGVTLPNATGLGNVENWQVKVGGVLKPKYSVRATAAGFVVEKNGLILIVR